MCKGEHSLVEKYHINVCILHVITSKTQLGQRCIFLRQKNNHAGGKWPCTEVNILWFKNREELNVGTVPMFKMHNIGTVPTFKMHNVGTLKIYDLYFELEFGLYGKNK